MWLILSLLLSAPSDGFRCPDTDRLVNAGQTEDDVVDECRQPDATRSSTRTVIFPDGTQVQVQVDDWTYDFGRDRLKRYLHFENGILIRVHEGRYGTT